MTGTGPEWDPEAEGRTYVYDEASGEWRDITDDLARPAEAYTWMTQFFDIIHGNAPPPDAPPIAEERRDAARMLFGESTFWRYVPPPRWRRILRRLRFWR